MRKILVAVALAIPVFVLLAGAKRRAVGERPPLAINAQRSMLISDQIILQSFTFQRVLDQLVSRSGVAGLTAGQLYRQWFDTQNPKPGLFDVNAPHCDDFLTDGKPSLNGIPRRCPTAEGALAAAPYGPDEYVPLALVNRFDLAAADGSNCGQYRIVFARQASKPTDKLHIIFEAVVPNPHPEVGLSGCREVARFWANLSAEDSPAARRDQLETFFFTGLAGYAPVVDPANYDGSANQSGVRTLEFGGNANRARFYQFRLTKSCASAGCTLRMNPDVLENLPFGRYFDGHDTSAVASGFRDAFIGQIASLAVNDADLFEMHIPATYLMGESDPVDDPFASDATTGFKRGLGTPEGSAFSAKIEAELKRVGSDLSAEQIFLRASTRGCNTCHAGFPANLTGGDPVLARFPVNFGLQMFDEARLVPGPDGPRYQPGTAIEATFLPHRIQILREFLDHGTAPVHSN